MSSEFLTSVQSAFATSTLVADSQGVLLILLGLFISVIAIISVYLLAINGFSRVAKKFPNAGKGK